MKRWLSVFAVFALGLAAGCATQEGVRPWWTLRASDFAAIQPGATKGQVEERVGKPVFAMIFPNLHEEVWDYRYLDGTFKYGASVHFDPQGRVKYYAEYLDRCPLGPVPCL